MTSSQKTTLIFLSFGIAWIYLTDRLFLFISQNSLRTYHQMQTWKGIAFIFFASILIYFVTHHLYKSLDRANQSLKASNQQLSVLLEEKVRYQQEIAQAIIKAQESERKQLGEELHDNINQILATTKLYLDLSLQSTSWRHDLLTKSSENINNVIGELRKLSKTLTPPTLGDLGLVPCITDLADSVTHVKNIQMDVYNDNFDENVVPHEKKLVIYRIIQEQMNNILRHSEAKHVTIELENNDNHVELTIQDDGVGFDTEKASAGIGLKNIRNRAELFNGSMQIFSSPGNGCTLWVEV